MQCTLIFRSFLEIYWFQDPLQPAHWKTLPWTTHSAIHHSGYSVFSTLISGQFSPFLQTPWPPALQGEPLSCNFSACCQPASFCIGTIHSSVLFPALKGRGFHSLPVLQLSLFEPWSHTPCWVRMTGSGAWSVCQKPRNLKIEHAQPHKSSAAYVPGCHKLPAIATNKIEGIRQKEVSCHN